MLAFRSEEHVNRWCDARRTPRGAMLTLDQTWGLGQAWYADKLSPDWRRASPEKAAHTFSSLGLAGDFWRLT